MSGGRQYVCGADGLPTGALTDRRPGPWDECSTAFDAPPGLRWPGALELVVDFSAEHWVLFDERAGELRLEPQRGPPAAPAIGAAVVVPAGARLSLRCTWRWRQLRGGPSG
ncbi:hypothetical protein SAMN05661080_01411 [Modestobacter sp. DSM 44400]|uniref:hypothetical protein n=1 Tax=Modestobacter sp. DSM 44400 TaxID=1550230 RepID=UPI00089677D6|nr:hypothetical protein [Modestobacter sp. DSM 44400]SDX84034.1 hypothetical protein SAMN05661080_01411 [Modestobacter sp. DSM 44400]